MKSLRDRIFQAISAVSITGLLTAIVAISWNLYGTYGQFSRSQLQDELNLAAAGVQQMGITYLKELPTETFRITWIDPEGNILYDSAGSMASHKDRQEFIEALETGSAFLERYSDTLMEKTVYLAEKLPDGSVLRIGQGQAAVMSWMLQTLGPSLVMLAGVLLLSMWLASSLSRTIIQPLNTLDLDDPLRTDIYSELLPMADRLESQYRQLRAKETSLNAQKAEFETVISTMNEAIVVYETEGDVLIHNKKAEELFDLKQLPQPGKFRKNGSIWQVEVDTVYEGCQVLLAYDITSSEELASSRQAFTANVSHELKTPLQTILGSSELLKSGMVRPEDVPQFGTMIHQQAGQLLSQVMDILRLSQLDELETVKTEPLSLDQEVYGAISRLRPMMDRARIRTEFEISSSMILGDRRMVQDIVSNLISNGIKFTDSWLKITVQAGRFTVSNNGPKIPAGDLPHIFERFYRGDKSRHSEDGSTGLGLSIVKHAAMLCQAEISVDTRDELTSFEVEFPVYEQPDR